MATYNNLPVYKICYDLILQIFASSRHMQRDYRFTLGETMKVELIALITNIYRANSRYQKKEINSRCKGEPRSHSLIIKIMYGIEADSIEYFCFC